MRTYGSFGAASDAKHVVFVSFFHDERTFGTSGLFPAHVTAPDARDYKRVTDALCSSSLVMLLQCELVVA